MTDLSSRVRDAGPVALLLGGALCVSCLATLGFALAAIFGLAAVPVGLGLTDPQSLLLTAGLLGALGILVVYKHRKVQRAVETGEDPDPYWAFHGPRAAVSLAAGFAAVAAVAVVSKLVVEATTSATYTIHWLETVPLLSLAFAWVIHGEWNKRVMGSGASDARSS